MILLIDYILQFRAEIIEAEKQKKDIRSIVLPSRASNPSTESVKTTSAVKSNVPEKSKR